MTSRTPRAIRTAISIAAGIALGFVGVGLLHVGLDGIGAALQFNIDLGMRLVLIVGLLFVLGAVLSRFGLRSAAAGLLAGAAIGWAVRSAHGLELCGSGRLFRPCTDMEVVLTITTPIVLAALGIFFGLAMARRTRPAGRVT